MPISAEQWRAVTGSLDAGKRSLKPRLSFKPSSRSPFCDRLLPPPSSDWKGYYTAMVLLCTPLLHKLYIVCVSIMMYLVNGPGPKQPIIGPYTYHGEGLSADVSITFMNPRHDCVPCLLFAVLSVLLYVAMVIAVFYFCGKDYREEKKHCWVLTQQLDHLDLYLLNFGPEYEVVFDPQTHNVYATLSLKDMHSERALQHVHCYTRSTSMKSKKATFNIGNVFLGILSSQFILQLSTLVVAMLLLLAGDVERNPGPVTPELTISHHPDVCNYINVMDTNQLRSLGGELGLLFHKLIRMNDLPADMVAAWLRAEDNVLKRSGPPSWKSLAKALNNIGQTGIASKIIKTEELEIQVDCTHAPVIPPYNAVQNSNPDITLPEWFDSLVSKCLACFKSRGISPQALANTILCLKLFESGPEESLLIECKNDLLKATSNFAIFEIVKPYMSFLNPELLAHIIEFLGSDDDCKHFKDYMKALEEYSKVTQAVLVTCQSEEMAHSVYEFPFKTINVVMETTSMSLKNTRNVKSEMAKILKLDIAALQIATTGGSPLAICFQLPKVACERVFPLSSEQERDFKSLGALSLQCGDYSFFQTIPTGPTNHDQVSDEDEIEIPCLGRPFRLGMFYDCRNDNLLLGIRLCNDDVIEEVLEEEPQISHSCEVLEDDSLEIKASSLELTTPIKLSLMSNLVYDISKSAKYWKDRCKSKCQVRVCLKYTNAMSMKRLPLNKLSEIQQLIFEGATHVVTGVLYGLDVYCIFDHMLKENERFEDVHENMLTVVKALSRFDSTGISDQTVSHCNVYSDIEYPCGTIQEVVDLFRELPSLPADKQPVPIPKFVRLYPLRKLDNRCKTIVRQVSTDLASQLQGILEVLHNVMTVANDLLSKYSVTFSKFQHTESRVTKFIEIITNYNSDLVKKIAFLLPGVREGTVDESKLAKVIKESSSSPFNSHSLNTWLEQVEEEVGALEMLADQLKHIEFISNRELQSISGQELNSDYLVCFAFHVAVEDDSFIDLLQKCLQTRESTQNQPKLTQSPQPLRWYANTEIMKKISSEIECFNDFAECNSKSKSTKFVVTNCVPHNILSTNGEPSIILLYEGTECKVWEPPGPPGKPRVKNITHNTVELGWSKPEYGSQSVECYQVSYHPVDNPRGGSVMTTNNAQETTTISGLRAGTKYVFSVKSKCEVGVGNKGDISDPVETIAASQVTVTLDSGANSNTLLPTMSANSVTASSQLQLANTNTKPITIVVTHNSVSLEWALPEQNSDNIDYYTIMFREHNSSKKWQKRHTSDSSIRKEIISGLSPQTKYIFKVRPELEDGDVGAWSEVSDRIETKAQVCQPGKPSASAVSHNSITLQWDEPDYDSENIESYMVRYRCVDGPSKNWNNLRNTDSNETKLTITDLTPQTKYIFKVRPVLEDGAVGAESEVSDPIATMAVMAQINKPTGLGKPSASAITHNSITLKWTNPEDYSEIIECYTVFYRSINDCGKWRRFTTETADEVVTISDLNIDTKYEFKVRSECGSDAGPSSELSDPITTRATSSPGKPIASDVTHNSIDLKWCKPAFGGESITQYKILCSSADKSNKILRECLTVYYQEDLLICDLSTDTFYTFQIVPICEGNVGCMSEVSDPTRTKPCSPPGEPKAVTVTHNSITMTWSKPDHGNENVEHYTLLVICADTIVDEYTTEGAQETIVIQHLEMGREYQFQIRSDCKSGFGMESKFSEIIKTKVTSPPGKPMKSDVTHDSISLRWTQPGEQDDGGIVGYKIMYRNVQKEKWEETNISTMASGPNLNATITQNIEIDSEYEFKVVPNCISGEGCESEVSDPIQTKSSSPPGKPVASSPATSNSVQIEWTKPEHGSENILEYECIVYSLANDKPRQEVKKLTTRGNEEKININELSPETEYVFKVQPHCDSPSGQGADSEFSDKIRTTPVLYQPGQPNIKYTTFNKVSLCWERPKNGWESMGSYSIHYLNHSIDSGDWEQWNEYIDSRSDKNGLYTATVKDLSPATLYKFKVKSHFKSSNAGERHVAAESETLGLIQTSPTSPPTKPAIFQGSITHNSVKLIWGPPEHCVEKIKSYRILVKLHTKFTQDLNMEPVFTTDSSTNFTINNLACKTRYSFTVIPCCGELGDGEISKRSDTIETLVSCRPGEIQCSASTYNSIELSWSKPEYYADDVVYYQITMSYHLTSTTDKTSSKPETEARLSKDNTFEVSELVHNTSYIFEVLPVCKKSSIVTESRTSCEIVTSATSPPTKLRSCKITHDSVTLEWTKPEFGSKTIKHYKVSVYHQGKQLFDALCTQNCEDNDLAIETFTVNNLKPDTKYVFKVQPVCKGDCKLGDESEPSDPIETYKTSPPGKVMVSDITHESLILSWSRPESGFNNVRSYNIYIFFPKTDCQTVGTWKMATRECLNMESQPNTCKILKLCPKTSYIFEVHPVCHNGNEPDCSYSEPIMTKATGPPGKPNVSDNSIDHNSITIEWEHPSCGYELVDHYIVSYMLINKQQSHSENWKHYDQKINCGTNCLRVHKLVMGSQYIFKVLPVCKPDQGEGTESESSDLIATKATSPPGKPTLVKVTHNSVELKWIKPSEGKVKKYTIHYRALTDLPGNWSNVEADSRESFIVTKLEPNTKYIFKVRPECHDHLCGSESQCSDEIKTHFFFKPGKPTASCITHESINLQWTIPIHSQDKIIIKCYNVSIKMLSNNHLGVLEQNPKSWNLKVTDNQIKVSKLKESTAYTFKVFAELVDDCEDIGTDCSDEEHFTTKEVPFGVSMYRRAQQQPEKSTISRGPPPIYKAEMKIVPHSKNFTKCYIGNSSFARGKPERVLMLVGPTGVGKSTVINFIANYIFGVKYEDDFRFQLITDEAHGKSQVYGQTKVITAYTFYPIEGSALDYTLTIIDTPGFGDPEGIERDADITSQIEEFFQMKPPQGIDRITSVGIVMPYAQPRLTPAQRYIFDSILTIFGKDIKDNIFLMLAYCDSGPPKVLEAIEEDKVPHNAHYKFNNSALYADNKSEDPLNKRFWQIGVDSLTKFFSEFVEIESKSLQLTKEVLKRQKDLEVLIEGLQKHITTSLDLIRELQQDKEGINANKSNVDSNKPFTFEVEVMRPVRKKLTRGKRATVCHECKFTCHFGCTTTNQQKLYKCAAMGGFYFYRNNEATCKVCKLKCDWFCHSNESYQYEMKPVKEQRSLDDLVKHYSSITSSTDSQQSRADSMLFAVEIRLKNAYDEVLQIIHETQRTIFELDDIALRSVHLSVISYIGFLITEEERGGKPGYVQRIHSLKILRERAFILSGVRKPIATAITSDSIGLLWNKPDNGDPISYTVMYCAANSLEWLPYPQVAEDQSITVEGLKPDTCYQFKVIPTFDGKSSSHYDSEESDIIKTKSDSFNVDEEVYEESTKDTQSDKEENKSDDDNSDMADEAEHLAVVEMAIKEKGKLEHIVAHGAFVGPAGSGKSSLILRLTGEKPNHTELSTGVAKSVVRVEVKGSSLTTVKVSSASCQWVKIVYSDETIEIPEVMKLTSQAHVSLSPPPTLTDHDKPHSLPITTTNAKTLSYHKDKPLVPGTPTCITNTDNYLSGEETASLPLATGPNTNNTLSTNKAIAAPLGYKPPEEIFKKALQGKELAVKEIRQRFENSWTFYLTDTGGQMEFQEVLPLLVSGPSIFFLIFRLNQNLHQPFTVEYRLSDGETSAPYQSTLTVEEAILQTLASVASMGTFTYSDSKTKSSPLKPKVLIVGTHKDLLDPATAESKIKEIDEYLQKVVKSTTHYDEDLVVFSSESQLIFTINNFSEDESDFEKIRSSIDQAVCHGNFKMSYPAHWLIFSVVLRQQTIKDRIISYEQCFTVAQDCGITTREELNHALWFLHTKIGLVRHFSTPGLDDIVIRDPQVLFDSVTHLIVETFTFENVGKRPFDEFKHKGIFSLEDLKTMERGSKFESLLSLDKLIELLKHLRIGAPFQTKDGLQKYFIPCVLTHSKLCDSQPPSQQSSTTPPLLITFKCGYCPKGLAGALIVYLLTNEMGSKFKWELQTSQMFRDEVSFRVSPYDIITLKIHSTYIELIHYREEKWKLSKANPVQSMCSDICQSVVKGIKKISSDMKLTSGADHSLSFYCQDHDCVQSNGSHPATFTRDENNLVDSVLLCKRSGEIVTSLPPEDFSLWFGQLLKSQTTDCGSKRVRREDTNTQHLDHDQDVSHTSIPAVDSEQPLYVESHMRAIIQKHKPETVNRRDSNLTSKQLKESVRLLFLTCNENEKWAVYEKLQPPSLEFLDPLPESQRALYLPQDNIVIGTFGGYSVAVLTTEHGKKGEMELKKHLDTLPNAQAILRVGVGYGKDQESIKLADVIVSNLIENASQVSISESPSAGVKVGQCGGRIPIRNDLLRYFNKTSEWQLENKFAVTKQGRISCANIGTIVSCETQITSTTFHEQYMGLMDQAVGGEMEGSLLLNMMEWMEQECRQLSVIVINGVAGYGDRQDYEHWQFTAAKAAVDFVHYCLKETDGMGQFLPVNKHQ